MSHRPDQALIGLSLTYEFFCKPESGLLSFVDLFFCVGLTYIKVCLTYKLIYKLTSY